MHERTSARASFAHDGDKHMDEPKHRTKDLHCPGIPVLSSSAQGMTAGEELLQESWSGPDDSVGPDGSGCVDGSDGYDASLVTSVAPMASMVVASMASMASMAWMDLMAPELKMEKERVQCCLETW